jgi:hypothetical protein
MVRLDKNLKKRPVTGSSTRLVNFIAIPLSWINGSQASTPSHSKTGSNATTYIYNGGYFE